MHIEAFTFSIVFAIVISSIAFLTSRHRGPFARAIHLLRGNEATYQAVSTMLWVVALGVVALTVASALFLEQGSFAFWGILFFASVPALVAALRTLVQRRDA
jgi:hypothetical protein